MNDDVFGAESYAAKAIRRGPLRLARRPNEYNFDRLPTPERYWDMELAVREFVEHARYGNFPVVTKPECKKRLEERVQALKPKRLGHVRIAAAPDLNEIGAGLRD